MMPQRESGFRCCTGRGTIEKKVDLSKCFLNAGANPNAVDYLGETALHRAAFAAAPEIVSLLIAHGANVHAEDFRGKTPLDYATKADRADVASILRQASQVPWSRRLRPRDGE